jgi:hypothetical protein
VGRQVTVPELFEELLGACGEIPADAALKIIVQHVMDGDRIKIDDHVIPATISTQDVSYQVGDPDPTPSEPPWCGARPTTGGPWCTWRPDHDGPHVSADEMGVLAVFEHVAEFHENAGKTREEIQAQAVAELPAEPAPPPTTETMLWRWKEDLRERVEELAKADKVGKRDLLEVVQAMAVLLGAVAERVEG